MEPNKSLLNKALGHGWYAKDNSSNHCSFCNAILNEVYETNKGKTKICPACFEKLKDEYNWTVEDWRIMAQEDYLMKVELKHVPHFRKFSDDWNHEHCEFCFAEISEADNTLHEAYCSLDEQNWICPTCYEDFKERFGWKLVEDFTESS